MRTYIYVDAFNLYYGALRHTPYRWLDIETLCRNLLNPKHSIERIKYFTALVTSRPSDLSQHVRQQVYIRALKTNAKVEVILGHFLTQAKRRPLVNPAPGASTTAEVLITEEKGSDVNLATHMVHDAHCGAFDAAIIISNDSDLAEAVRIVRQELGLVVGVLNPHPNPSVTLKRLAIFFKPIRKGVLAASQLPPTLKDCHGEIHKPATW